MKNLLLASIIKLSLIEGSCALLLNKFWISVKASKPGKVKNYKYRALGTKKYESNFRTSRFFTASEIDLLQYQKANEKDF